MDENRIEGAARNAAGKVQRAVGSATGDDETEARGGLREVAGKAQNLYGQAVDSVQEYTGSQPFSALLIAGGIGMALGVLLGRSR